MNDEYPEGWDKNIPAGVVPQPRVEKKKNDRITLVVLICGILLCLIAMFFDIVIIMAIVAGALAYFAPTIVALRRNHRNAAGIILLNLFLGWTLLGWVGALIWAVYQDKR